MAPSFVLIMQDGPTPGARTELQRRSLLLGRDPSSDLAVNDVEVSRRHARLIAQSNGYAVEDLGSTNGTFVNGQRIKSAAPLRSGDIIRMGDKVSFVFEEVMVVDENASTTGIPSRPMTPSTSPRPSASQVTGELPPLAQPAAEVKPAAHAMPAAEADDIEYADPAPASRRRARRSGLRLPVFSQPWVVPAIIIAVFGACALTAFLWYVDANLLWCDVFGGLIAACG